MRHLLCWLTMVTLLAGVLPNALGNASAQTFPGTSVSVVLPNDSEQSDERIAAQTVVDLPASGVRLVRTKLVDERTAQVREVVTDAATGAPVSMDVATEREQQAWRKNYGSADPELVARLETAAADEAISVGIQWVPGGENAVRTALDRLEANILRERHGLLEASVPVRHVRELMHQPFVAAIAPVPRPRNLAVNMARDMGQAAIDDAHRLGVGLGLITAVWELEACIRRDHPDFRSINWLPRPGATPCNYGADGNSGETGHSTSVAGALAADRGSKGTVGLYRAKMVDIDDTDPANVDRMWALNPHIVNASFTMTQFEAQRVDQEAYKRGTYVFVGAGNDHADTANCWAYNALCVGGYRTNGTVGQFTDDSVLDYSYLNPTSGREFPHVVGPAHGSFPSATGTGYTGTRNGTSYATPAVAGTAGLLLSTYPLMRPALMRAVLMASAQAHPVADRHGGPRIPDTDDGYDDRHGAGAPNGDRAKAIMDKHMYFYDKTFYPSDLGAKATIGADPGERVRVVMAWDQCPYETIFTTLNADFDLVVRRQFTPTQPVFETYSNLSSEDNYEIVEFVAYAGGTYTINVSAPRWSTCAAEGGIRRARLALAWTKERSWVTQ